MKNPLPEFQNTLIEHALKDSSLLSCLSVYQCYKSQKLHQVLFHQPTLVIVAQGQKLVQFNDGSRLTVHAGDLFVVPPETTLCLSQYPESSDGKGQKYLGLALRFDRKAIKHFRLVYGSSLDQWDLSACWRKKAPESIITVLSHWIGWDADHSTLSQLKQLKQVELLLLLAHEGLIGNILLGEHPSWKQRVSQMLMFNPAHVWQIKEVCSRLAVSESSLQRKLQNEQTSFRELLEESRLTAGLGMLLETSHPVGQVSNAVGYQSQSRFAERFKHRFGMTPSELRNTLEV